jgi:hypothetical protein
VADAENRDQLSSEITEIYDFAAISRILEFAAEAELQANSGLHPPYFGLQI